MRVLVLVKEDQAPAEGQLPPEEISSGMDKFNEELTKAGVLLAAEGLWPSNSNRSKRVRFDGKTKRSVIDGPFTETKELIAGFWIWQVRSMDEAIEWLKRAPFQWGDIEIRAIQEQEDYEKDLEERRAKARR